MGFPGATADRSDAAYVVVGAPLDVSTTFRPGTRFGPDRIRTQTRAVEDFDHLTGRRFTDLRVADIGDVRAWDDGVEYLEFLEGELADVHADGAVPLVLGGEHTVSVAGVRATEPDVFVTLDAHLDLRESFDGNPWSHACTTRRALETAEEAVIIGARTGSEREWTRAEKADVEVVEPADIGAWSPAFDPETTVYLSVDIDAADPAVAPGTGTLAPFGLSGAAMRDVVREIAPQAVGFDVVEVNDHDHGQAAALAGQLTRTFVFAHADGMADTV